MLATGNDLNDPAVASHMMRVHDYLWGTFLKDSFSITNYSYDLMFSRPCVNLSMQTVAEDGMKMQGYNGSQCWDTSFCTQALFEANLLDEFPDVSRKIWKYLERTQILSTAVSK